MRPFDDPSELSADQIRSELAAILAAGVLRVRKRRTEKPAEIPAKPAAERLEVPRKTVLSVHTG